MRATIGLLAGLALPVWVAAPASATVFISEVFMNPPGSLDETAEYIELQGTPGRKLDGLAIAFVNGTLDKFYPLNSIPPLPATLPEIDELFSLDGLELGPNGILVLAHAGLGNFPEMLPDANFRGNWADMWNGSTFAGGRLQNDGSNSIFLIRNRPGSTEAEPQLLPIWFNDAVADFQLITPVFDDNEGVMADQFGDGDLDRGGPSGLGGNTRDMIGLTTPTLNDDLEIVDEVSYEHERGWEYDIDERKVDRGLDGGLPERRVHALDDPQGFNPDCLTRVDYRTSGPGHPPAPGGTGEMDNGNNWPDTATEQWIRGESTLDIGPNGPEFRYDNATVTDVDAVQPYTTNVPLWLDDGVGADYDFAGTYRIKAGHVNPLAIPYIPGDVDRDGDCDADDIAKMAEVFTDADWLFINSYDESPEGNEVDPATQTRPWDVDLDGNGAIDPNDLQWVLNFQGNTNGRIVGRTYDSVTPSAVGVHLNEGDVTCDVSLATGGATEVTLGETIQVIVSGEVTGGANMTAGQENGIMQFFHDLSLSPGGRLRVVAVEPAGSFGLTRESLMSFVGTSGGLGVDGINGHGTSFAPGIGGASELYRVTLEAVGLGAVSVVVDPAGDADFAGYAPGGIKVGHMVDGGTPAGVNYPGSLMLTVVEQEVVQGDCNGIPGIGGGDHACLVDCLDGPSVPIETSCAAFDFDGDGDVDAEDVAGFQNAFGGE